MAVVYEDEYRNKRNLANTSNSRRAQADRTVGSAREALSDAERRRKNTTGIDMRELDVRLSNVRQQTEEEIAQISEDLRLAMGRHAEEYQRQIAHLRRQATTVDRKIGSLEEDVLSISHRLNEEFRAITDQIASQKQRASAYIAELVRICDSIAGLHPDKLELHFQELLAPGTKTISDSLQYLQFDMENEDYQAAIGVAQTRIPEALYIQSQLEVLNARFQQTQSDTNNEADYAAQCRNRAAEIMDVPDAEYINDRDTDYWTEGMYSRLVHEYESAQANQTLFAEDMDIEGLEHVRQEFKRLAAQFLLCREIAETQFRLSCQVQDAAQAVWDILRADGKGSWLLQSGNYFSDDYRSSYILSMEDSFGHYARIVISPLQQSRGSCPVTYDIAVFDAMSEIRNPVICESMRNGLIAVLHAGGINISHQGGLLQQPFQTQDEFCSTIAMHCNQQRNLWLSAVQRDNKTLR